MANARAGERPVIRGRPLVKTEIGDRLLDCLHQDPARTERTRQANVTAEEWAALFTLARAHKIDALLAYRLGERGLGIGLPDAVRQATSAARRHGMHWALLVRESVTHLVTALQARGIPVIVLKGAHLAHVVYPDPSLRWMIDVDLLVQSQDLQRAATLLRADGFRQIAPGEDGPSSAHPVHLPRFVGEYPPAVELHWRLGQADVPLPAELWQRAVPVHIAGVDTLGLSPEDLLLHLCIHGSDRHRFEHGLRPLCDVAETVRHFGGAMDWADVEERARRYHQHRRVYLMLRLAKEMLGAPVPDDVLGVQPSEGLDHALRTARFLTLEGNQIGRGFPLRVVGVSSATSWPDRLRALWRGLFVSTDFIAAYYRLPPRSPRLLLYYPVRLKDLLKRHWSVMLGLLRRDPVLIPMARDVVMIQRWLSDDDEPDLGSPPSQIAPKSGSQV